MKKILAAFIAALFVFLCACGKGEEKNETSVISSAFVIEAENNGTVFLLSDGKVSFKQPEILSHLTLFESGEYVKADYSGICTELAEDAFCVPYILKNAIKEMEESGEKFKRTDGVSVYNGTYYDIITDDPSDPKKITVKTNGRDIEYNVLSVTQ